MSQAARAELDRIVGTNKNDLLKLENVLGQPQDWNAQKLGGRVRSGQSRPVDGSARPRARVSPDHQDVVQGSQTAQRTAAKRGTGGRPAARFRWKRTAFGAATRGGAGSCMIDSAVAPRKPIAIALRRCMATQDPAELNVIVNRSACDPGGPGAARENSSTRLARGAFIGGGTAIGRRE